MALHVLNSDWLSQNANRNYPLVDGASCASVDGGFTIPPDFLLDLTWPVHVALSMNPAHFYLKSIVSAGTVVIGTLAYWNDGSPVPVASFTVNVDTHESGGVYELIGSGEYSDSVGQVVLGNLGNVTSQGGRYEFDLSGAGIAPLCVRPNLRGVSSLRVVRGTDAGEPLHGDIRLVAGDNIRFTVEGNSIRVDAVSGVGLDPQNCDCGGALGTPIRTINGVGPDSEGRFTLTGDECFEISAIQNGLRFTDKCSQSCCGCEELATITSTCKEMQQTLANLQRAIAILQSEQGSLVVNVLASATNDRGKCGA